MSIAPGNDKPSYRNKSRIFGQYIIKNHFQFKFGFIFFGILASSTFLLWLESNVSINRLIESDFVKDPALLEQLKLISGMIGTTAIIVSAASFALALFLSHFIAGPMFSFEKKFKDLENGDLTVIMRLRKHDQFKDVAEAFNRALSSLRNKIKKERDGTAVLLTQISKLSQSMKTTPNSADAEQLDKLILELRNQTSQIKII